jgi:hypothetical protein
MATRQATDAPGFAGWLERHTGLGPVLRASVHVRIPMSARTYYFGGIALFLFGIRS